MKCKVIIACFFTFIFSITSNAHTDTILNQEGYKLVGLPEEFTPAVFNWEKKLLRIGENQIDLNSFENVIPMRQEYKIYISSSWYHKRSALPPYIGIVLKPKDRTFKYTILLKLETLELIKVTLDYRIHGEISIQCPNHELKIRDYDLKQINSRTRKVE